LGAKANAVLNGLGQCNFGVVACFRGLLLNLQCPVSASRFARVFSAGFALLIPVVIVIGPVVRVFPIVLGQAMRGMAKISATGFTSHGGRFSVHKALLPGKVANSKPRKHNSMQVFSRKNNLNW
jgi:hypothetical protein